MNVHRSFVESVHIDELEEDRRPKDRLKHEASPSTQAPHMQGL